MTNKIDYYNKNAAHLKNKKGQVRGNISEKN